MMISSKLTRILCTQRKPRIDLLKIFCRTNRSDGRKFELFKEIHVGLKEKNQEQSEGLSNYVESQIEKTLDKNKHRVSKANQKDFFSAPQLAKFEQVLSRDTNKISHWVKVSSFDFYRSGFLKRDRNHSPNLHKKI